MVNKCAGIGQRKTQAFIIRLHSNQFLKCTHNLSLKICSARARRAAQGIQKTIAVSQKKTGKTKVC